MADDGKIHFTEEQVRRFNELIASMPPPLPDDAPFGTIRDVAEMLGSQEMAAEAFDHAGIDHAGTINAGQFRSWFRDNATCDE